MENCKFKSGSESCHRSIVAWGLCQEHEALRTKTHDFYKQAEAQYRKVDPDESDEYLFEKRHNFLLLAVAARIVHAELFYEDERCENHALYAGSLYWHMKQEEVLLFKRGKGFVVEGSSYNDMLSTAKASLKQAFIDWSKSDRRQRIEYFIRSFPRAIASGNEVPEPVLLRMHPPEYTDW
ncbi:hypothetical protein F5Y12DRAFT_711907 [Xylaria sp. FL1777]|nr:hypothetical protein F5Y12DRAFT_711907 [Xylaria sp. FL1777]